MVGRVVSGMDIVDTIKKGAGEVETPDRMVKVTVQE